jgi:RNA-binding protein
MSLTNRQKKQFRAIGHQLKPVVTVGAKGITEGVLTELDRALTDHELIKIRVNQDRDERPITLAQITEKMNAEIVQAIGRTALILKPSKNPDPHLSNLLRKDVFTS